MNNIVLSTYPQCSATTTATEFDVVADSLRLRNESVSWELSGWRQMDAALAISRGEK